MPETVTINVVDGAATQKSGSAIASEQPPLTLRAVGLSHHQRRQRRPPRSARRSPARPRRRAWRCRRSAPTPIPAPARRLSRAARPSTSASPTSATTRRTCVAGQTLGDHQQRRPRPISRRIPTSGVSTLHDGAAQVQHRERRGAVQPQLLRRRPDHARRRATTSRSAAGAGSGNTMLGSSQFVVQPYNFALSNIKCTTYGAGTCAASPRRARQQPRRRLGRRRRLHPGGAAVLGDGHRQQLPGCRDAELRPGNIAAGVTLTAEPGRCPRAAMRPRSTTRPRSAASAAAAPPARRSTGRKSASSR